MTIDLHPSGDASTRGWGPGWPHNDGSLCVRVTLSNGVSVIVRAGIAMLVKMLAEETIRRGYHFKVGQCFGFANRPIVGVRPPVASNHSWGLAIDWNTLTNPRRSPLTTDMPAWMVALWERYGFRWGGHYSPPTTPDAMHYEFMGTPLDASHLTAAARIEFAPKPKPVPVEDDVTTLYQHKIPGHLNAEYAVTIDPIAQVPIVKWVIDPAHRDGLIAAGAHTATPPAQLPVALVPFITGTLPGPG